MCKSKLNKCKQAKSYFVPDMFNDSLMQIICNDNYKNLTPEEYCDNVFTLFAYKSDTPIKHWIQRMKSDVVLTESDITIDDINNIIHSDEKISGYLNNNIFKPICYWTCDRPEIKMNDKHELQAYENGIKQYTYDNVHDIIKNPECIYIAKCNYKGVTYWLKIGKTSSGFNVRKSSYNRIGCFAKRSTITEIYMKRLLEAGLKVEFYALKIPVNDPYMACNTKIVFNNPINSANLEIWLRNEIVKRYKKTFIENYNIK